MTTKFDRFTTIKHIPLRVYNRTVMMLNIQESFGKTELMNYIESFSPEERKQMYSMSMFIKHKGPDAARKFATRGVEFADG